MRSSQYHLQALRYQISTEMYISFDFKYVIVLTGEAKFRATGL